MCAYSLKSSSLQSLTSFTIGLPLCQWALTSRCALKHTSACKMCSGRASEQKGVEEQCSPTETETPRHSDLWEAEKDKAQPCRHCDSYPVGSESSGGCVLWRTLEPSSFNLPPLSGSSGFSKEYKGPLVAALPPHSFPLPTCP